MQQVVAGADQAVEAGLLQAQIGEEARRAPRAGSTAISASILAEIDHAAGALFLGARLDLARTARCRSRPSLRRRCRRRAPASRSAGRADETASPPRACARRSAPACPRAAASATRLTRSSVSLASLASSPLPLAFFSSASTRFSRLSRSASISSVSIVSMSATGSIRPSTWVTSSSSKQRTTCAMASTSRMLARNWLPSPSPFEAPLHQAGDVDERQPRRHDLLGLGELRQRVEPRIRHRHLADIRLDGAERIVRRLRRRGLRSAH